MKFEHAKKLIQHITHSKKSDRFTSEDFFTLFPELVELSQKSYTPTRLYRVLMLESDNDLNGFGVDSLSHNISSCLNIANSMPSIVFTKDSTISLDAHLFSFNVPKDRILIDFDTCLPLIEDKLKKCLNHKVYDKHGSPVSIKKAIEQYRNNDEREVIADISGLEFTRTKVSNQLYSMNLIARDFENLKESTLYYNNLDTFQKNLFPIMSKIDQKKFHVWKDRLLIPEEKPIKNKSSTPKGWVPAF
ncbi:hypothetical protein ACFKA9_004901 [Vibrio parahaemolyticus]